MIVWADAVRKAAPLVPHPQMVSAPNMVVLAEVREGTVGTTVQEGMVAPLFMEAAVAQVVVRKAEILQELAEFGVHTPQAEARRLEPLTKQG